MTVREFTDHLWYTQKIIIIKWKEFDWNDSIDVMESKALMVGENHQLLSIVYDAVNDMSIDSYGVIDNTLIIEVK